MVGSTISHYKMLEKIGEGGMGIVYKAHDTTLDRTIALKFLPHYLTSDLTEKERFYHEARAASALNHPNITTIYEIAEHDGQVYMAMEYIEGKTLKQLVHQEAPSLKKALDIAIQVCDGLSAAEEKKIVHRDIKSDNIMITQKGQVKIMDFGLAKVKGATKITKAGSTLGTAAYMSPEQAQGEEIDHRSDIFSFGVVLYELLTTNLPFRGEHQAALMYSLMNEEPQPIARFNNTVTPEMERIVSKALAKDREDRYQHIDDMLADLRRERKNFEYARTGYIRTPTGTSVPAMPSVPPSAKSASSKKYMKYIIAAAAVVIIVIAVLIFNPFNLQVSTQKSSAAPEKNSLAVLYFQNIIDPQDKDHTADMLTDLLITSLSQSKDIEVISRERLYDIQKEFQIDSKSISSEMAVKVAQRAGVTTMLLGSIVQAEPLAITTRLIDVKTGKIVGSQRVSGYSSKQVFALVDTLALLVKNDLQVSPESKAEATSVATVTTSSPEAYRSYVEAVDLNNKFYLAEARAAFNRAIELDSNFAMAYFAYASSSIGLSDEERIGLMTRAWNLRDKVSEKERLQIEAQYTGRVEGNSTKSAALMEQFLTKYPHEVAEYLNLSTAYNFSGEFEKSLQVILRGLQNVSLDKELWNTAAYLYAEVNRKQDALAAIDTYMRLVPAEPNPYDSKGDIYYMTGDPDSAAYWWRKALSFRTDFPSSAKLAEYAFLRQNYDDARKYFQQWAGSTGDKAPLYTEFSKFMIEEYQGQLNLVRRQSTDLLAQNEQQLSHDEVLSFLKHIVVDCFELGDFNAMANFARRLVQEAKKNPRARLFGRDVLALALLKSGDATGAEKTLADLDTLSMLTFTERGVIDYAHALLKFEEEKYPEALQQFEQLFRRVPPRHAPQYFQALALLKQSRFAEATDELQRMTRSENIQYPFFDFDALTMVEYQYIGAAKAHYWLGVAYEQLHQKEQAIAEYQRFTEIWKNADFKSPELADAKARLTKLKGTAMK